MNRKLKLTQDVLDRLSCSFLPLSKFKQSTSMQIDVLHVENGLLDIEVLPGKGSIEIIGTVSEKELRQVAELLHPNSLPKQPLPTTIDNGDN